MVRHDLFDPHHPATLFKLNCPWRLAVSQSGAPLIHLFYGLFPSLSKETGGGARGPTRIATRMQIMQPLALSLMREDRDSRNTYIFRLQPEESANTAWLNCCYVSTWNCKLLVDLYKLLDGMSHMRSIYPVQ